MRYDHLKIIMACCIIFCTSTCAWAADLSSLYNGYGGAKWGESFSELSRTMTLAPKAHYIPKDNESDYKVLLGMPQEFHDMPVEIHLKFKNEQLLHISLEMDGKYSQKVMDTLQETYGAPTAHPQKFSFIWQDDKMTVFLITPLTEMNLNICSLLMTSNAFYEKLQGKPIARF